MAVETKSKWTEGERLQKLLALKEADVRKDGAGKDYAYFRVAFSETELEAFTYTFNKEKVASLKTLSSEAHAGIAAVMVDAVVKLNQTGEPRLEVKSIDAAELFWIMSCDCRNTRKMTKFLSMQLRDLNGTVFEAKKWDVTEEEAKLFRAEDIVGVIIGKREMYNGREQLIIDRMMRLDERLAGPKDFLKSLDEGQLAVLKEDFLQLVSEVKNEYLAKLLSLFLADKEVMERFYMAPAAKFFHHAYLGGLLEHTVTVAKLCKDIADNYNIWVDNTGETKHISHDLVLAAALLHDIGKIRELTFLDYSPEGNYLGHIVMADEMVRDKIREIHEFPDELTLLLRHILLSHHGQLDWGSPVTPGTTEAIILHHVDNLDAKLKRFREEN